MLYLEVLLFLFVLIEGKPLDDTQKMTWGTRKAALFSRLIGLVYINWVRVNVEYAIRLLFGQM